MCVCVCVIVLNVHLLTEKLKIRLGIQIILFPHHTNIFKLIWKYFETLTYVKMS